MAHQRRSSDEWQQLMAEFESGNDNAATFCRTRGISTSNFYKRRAARVGSSPSAFVAARREAPSATLIAVQFNDVTIRCDTQTSVIWVSDLVAALRG